MPVPLHVLRLADVRQTSSFRLIATLGLVLVAAIMALQALTYTLTQRELLARSDAVLKSEMARFGAVPGDRLVAALNDAGRQSASGFNYFALENAQGALVAGNLHWHGAALPDHPLELAAGVAAPVPLRVLVHGLPGGQRIIVARDIGQIAEIRQRLLWLSLAVGLGGAGVGGGACRGAQSWALAPGADVSRQRQTHCRRRTGASHAGFRPP